MDVYLGMIGMFGFNFTINGWAPCNGQNMSIAQNTALFSLLGTTFGGDGVQTFALPDLRGRMPIGQGQGPGLTPRQMGEKSGTENVTILVSNLPAHTHGLSGTSAAPASGSPAGALLATQGRSGGVSLFATGTADTAMAPTAIQPTGSSQPLANMPPYLVMNYQIALQGIYPSRA